MSDVVLAKGPLAPHAPGALTLAFDWSAWSAARANGGEAVAWEDLIPAAEAVAIRDGSEAAASDWHRFDGEDFTAFRGVSLGRPHRWLLWLTALPAFKLASALRAAKARSGPGRLIVQESLPPEFRAVAVAAAAADPSWRLEFVPGAEGGPATAPWRRPAPSVSRAKVLAGRLADLASRGGRGRRPLLMSYYPSLDGLLGRLLDDDSPFRCFMVDMPARKHLPRLLGNGGRVLFEARGSSRLSAPDRNAVADMRAAWTRAKNDAGYRARYAYAGVDLFDAISPVAEEFAQASLEPLAWTCSYYARLWEVEPPAAVLMAYNESPLVHLLADLARSRGTPAITMQHGLPQGRRLQFGESNTSHFLVWGPEQKETFARTDSLKCFCEPVGNPGFDRYAAFHAGVKNAPPPRTAKRVLLLSSPSNAVIELSGGLDAERFATAAADALLSRPGFEVTLKIHPAESLESYRALLAGRPLRIVKDAPVSECLRETDLVVGPFSTVLLEAMIAGKPLLCLNASRAPFPPPFDGGWGIPELHSGPEFEAALDAITADPARRLAEITTAYPRILAAFVGPIDGGSVERALAALKRLSRL